MFENLEAQKVSEFTYEGLSPVEGYAFVYVDENNKYYWADECGELTGVYDTAEEANKAVDVYCEWLRSEYYGEPNVG